MHLYYRRSRLLMLLLDSPAGWRQRLVGCAARRAAAGCARIRAIPERSRFTAPRKLPYSQSNIVN